MAPSSLLQEVVGIIQANVAERPVTIASSVGVAGLWLLPRLGNFIRQHPNVDVRVSASNELSDLRSEDLDLAIRYCLPTPRRQVRPGCSARPWHP